MTNRTCKDCRHWKDNDIDAGQFCTWGICEKMKDVAGLIDGYLFGAVCMPASDRDACGMFEDDSMDVGR